MDKHTLMSAIEQHSARTGLKPSTICQYAVANRLFYENLVAGKDYQIGTATRLLEWITVHTTKYDPIRSDIQDDQKINKRCAE